LISIEQSLGIMEKSLWNDVWKRNFTNLPALLDFCEISPEDRQKIVICPAFSINVPERLVKKMEKGNINDPLFRQFVPFKSEEETIEGFCEDPLHEASARCSERVLQKYAGRALIVTTQSCGMHCRFCFRRHYPYTQSTEGFDNEIAWVSKNKEISEVVFSGGDPLALPPRQFEKMVISFNEIPHVKRLRFHTRIPIGIPERIDQGLLECLQRSLKQIYFVVHINHPREMDMDVQQSLSQLLRIKIPVLSQTVLLRGVNDSEEVLCSLMETLGNSAIIPYYLFQLDRVKGAAHFEVPVQEGLRLMRDLRKRLPGYLVPRFVQEVAGEPSKAPLPHSP
jgi:EF-P beta-lysylation protein EpmB